MSSYAPPKWNPLSIVKPNTEETREQVVGYIQEVELEFALAMKDLKTFKTWGKVGDFKGSVHHAEVASRLLHQLDDYFDRLAEEQA